MIPIEDVLESLLELEYDYLKEEIEYCADGVVYTYDEFSSYVVDNPNKAFTLVVSYDSSLIRDIYYNNGSDNIHIYFREAYSNSYKVYGNMINPYRLLCKIPGMVVGLCNQDEVITNKVKVVLDAYIDAKRTLTETVERISN